MAAPSRQSQSVRSAPAAPQVTLRPEGDVRVLLLSGEWCMDTIAPLAELLASMEGTLTDAGVVDGSNLSRFDSAGAYLLLEHLRRGLGGGHPPQCTFRGFLPEYSDILTLVQERFPAQHCPPTPATPRPLVKVGEMAFHIGHLLLLHTWFLGNTVAELVAAIRNPRRFRARELFVQLEKVCIDGIPVVALVSGLIGIVLAYLFASQMEKYGAHLFVADAVGVAMCRELAPLIAAIIMAGRSGSAFTAQLGTMKLNEEIDALRVLGLSPFQVLVLPRVMALTVGLPILTAIGGAVGILGGALIAQSYLGITPTTYFDRIHTALAIKHVWVGLVKAPMFALVIALIGCQQGLTVEDNARSVGDHTTSTVVQSIVAVIVINAVYAVVTINMGY